MLRSEHILVVEDDPTDAFFLQRAFKRAGIAATLHFVQGGKEAIDYLRSDADSPAGPAHPVPDLLLLDLKMPHPDGLDVLGWIRKQARLKSLSVAIFSSSEERRDIDRAYELGASSYIVKPHSIQGLTALVASLKTRWAQFGEMDEAASQRFGG